MKGSVILDKERALDTIRLIEKDSSTGKRRQVKRSGIIIHCRSSFTGLKYVTL